MNPNKKIILSSDSSNTTTKDDEEEPEEIQTILSDSASKPSKQKVFSVQSLLYLIFQYLDLKSLLHCDRVCRRWSIDSKNTNSVYFLQLDLLDKAPNSFNFERFKYVRKLSYNYKATAGKYYLKGINVFKQLKIFEKIEHLSIEIILSGTCLSQHLIDSSLIVMLKNIQPTLQSVWLKIDNLAKKDINRAFKDLKFPNLRKITLLSNPICIYFGNQLQCLKLHCGCDDTYLQCLLNQNLDSLESVSLHKTGYYCDRGLDVTLGKKLQTSLKRLEISHSNSKRIASGLLNGLLGCLNAKNSDKKSKNGENSENKIRQPLLESLRLCHIFDSVDFGALNIVNDEDDNENDCARMKLPYFDRIEVPNRVLQVNLQRKFLRKLLENTEINDCTLIIHCLVIPAAVRDFDNVFLSYLSLLSDIIARKVSRIRIIVNNHSAMSLRLIMPLINSITRMLPSTNAVSNNANNNKSSNNSNNNDNSNNSSDLSEFMSGCDSVSVKCEKKRAIMYDIDITLSKTIYGRSKMRGNSNAVESLEWITKIPKSHWIRMNIKVDCEIYGSYRRHQILINMFDKYPNEMNRLINESNNKFDKQSILENGKNLNYNPQMNKFYELVCKKASIFSSNPSFMKDLEKEVDYELMRKYITNCTDNVADVTQVDIKPFRLKPYWDARDGVYNIQMYFENVLQM